MTRSYRHLTFEERCQVRIPGKDSKEERTFKGLDCATPGPAGHHPALPDTTGRNGETGCRHIKKAASAHGGSGNDVLSKLAKSR